MNLTYQQIAKILEDCEIEKSIYHCQIVDLNKRLKKIKKKYQFINLKIKVYNELKKKSSIDFSCDLPSPDAVDDIASIL